MRRIAIGTLLIALPITGFTQPAEPAGTLSPGDWRKTQVWAGDLPAEPRQSAASPAPEQDAPRPRQHRWLVQTSLYTRHFDHDPDHNNRQNLINIEYQRQDEWLLGAAAFRNSFDQPSQLAYFGKRWYPSSSWPQAHVKFVVGLLHGYKPPYDEKIPFNSSGIAPVILPAIGWSHKQFATEIIVFGTAGVLWTVGFYLD